MFQWYKKVYIEEFGNNGEEIDEEMFEAFEDYSENDCWFDDEINEAIIELWKNFKESYEDELGLAHQPCYCDGGFGKK